MHFVRTVCYWLLPDVVMQHVNKISRYNSHYCLSNIQVQTTRQHDKQHEIKTKKNRRISSKQKQNG